jgi:hypothetical protein
MAPACRSHGTSMQIPWHQHADPMAPACRSHGTSMQIPWHQHADSMAPACRSHGTSMQIPMLTMFVIFLMACIRKVRTHARHIRPHPRSMIFLMACIRKVRTHARHIRPHPRSNACTHCHLGSNSYNCTQVQPYTYSHACMHSHAFISCMHGHACICARTHDMFMHAKLCMHTCPLKHHVDDVLVACRESRHPSPSHTSPFKQALSSKVCQTECSGIGARMLQAQH